MPRMFSDCLADGGEAAVRAYIRRANANLDCLNCVAPTDDVCSIEISAEMDNLVGEGANAVVKQWVSGVGKETAFGAASRESQLVIHLGKFLGAHERQFLMKQLSTISLQKQAGADDQDSEAEGEAEARGRAADYFFASTSPMAASTCSPIDKMSNVPSSSISHSSSLPFMTYQLTPCRHTSLRKCSPYSRKQISPLLSMESGHHSQASQLSIISLSPSHFNSVRSSDERAYHSLFDALQFNEQSSTTAFNLHIELSREVLPSPRPTFATRNVMNLPCLTSYESPKLKEALRVSAMPLVSPSVTPSPPRPPLHHTSAHTPIIHVLPTSVHRSNTSPPLRDTRGQLHDVAMRPPMLDLKKILKHNSSSTGLSCRPAKRKSTRLSLHALNNSPTAAKGMNSSSCLFKGSSPHLGRAPEYPSAHILPHCRSPAPISKVVASGSPPVAPLPALLPSSRSIEEKERRLKAKAKQIQVRAKLVRALPCEKISPTSKAKVQRRERELAALCARNKAKIIVRRRSMYGVCETSPRSLQRSPSCQPEPLEHQDTVSRGILPSRTVIFDDSAMDWEKSKEYQEGFMAQRKEGIRYPPLPRLERSFAESQSP